MCHSWPGSQSSICLGRLKWIICSLPESWFNGHLLLYLLSRISFVLTSSYNPSSSPCILKFTSPYVSTFFLSDLLDVAQRARSGVSPDFSCPGQCCWPAVLLLYWRHLLESASAPGSNTHRWKPPTWTMSYQRPGIRDSVGNQVAS